MGRDLFFDELLDQGGVLTLNAPAFADRGLSDDDEWFEQAATGQRVVADAAATLAQAPLGSAAMPLEGDLVRPPRRRTTRPAPLTLTNARHKRPAAGAVLLVVLLAVLAMFADPRAATRRTIARAGAAHEHTSSTLALASASGQHRPRGLGATPTRRAQAPAQRRSPAAHARRRTPRRAAPVAGARVAHAAAAPVIVARPVAPAPTPAPAAAPAPARAPATVQRVSSSAPRSPSCYPGDLAC